MRSVAWFVISLLGLGRHKPQRRVCVAAKLSSCDKITQTRYYIIFTDMELPPSLWEISKWIVPNSLFITLSIEAWIRHHNYLVYVETEVKRFQTDCSSRRELKEGLDLSSGETFILSFRPAAINFLISTRKLHFVKRKEEIQWYLCSSLYHKLTASLMIFYMRISIFLVIKVLTSDPNAQG